MPPKSKNRKKLESAFQEADRDCDGRLRHSEVQEFGTKMFGKDCSYEVYVGMCNYCNRDPEMGLSWEDVLKLFEDSNSSGKSQRVSYTSNRRRSLSTGPRKGHQRSASVGVGINHSHRKIPRRNNPLKGHRRARSELASSSHSRRTSGSRSAHSRRSSNSDISNIFDRFQSIPTRDKDRELVNLLLERLRETQMTIEDKQNECKELTRDLTEQRERRMSAENRIKRHRQEVEALHSRNSVDVHRESISWERYRALSEELSAVEEATMDARIELRSCGKRVDNLQTKRIALKQENVNLRRRLEKSGIPWKRRLEAMKCSQIPTLAGKPKTPKSSRS